MDDTTAHYVNTYAPPVATDTQSQPDVPTTPEPAAVEPTPAPVAPAPTPMPAESPTAASQTLEDQNIFFLLGVTDGSEAEKEAFLDELQHVIWEDFLENDVELLITEEEQVELKKIMDQPGANELELQEKIIVYLEKLIPDLEEIMLEKALELKEDMARERITGMREYYADKAEALDTIQRAETAMNDNQWRTAAELLNGV